MPEKPARQASSSRPTWRPTVFTWLGGAVLLLFLIISAASGGFGGFLITLSLTVLATAIYLVATRRPTWMNLPRSRPLGAVGIGAALVVVIIGSSLYGAAHPTKTDAQPRTPFAQTSATPQDVSGVRVSNVVGTGAREAESMLEEKGLRITVKTADGSDAPTNLAGWTVDSQYPTAGSDIHAHGEVILTLSAPTATAAPTTAGTPSSTPAPAVTTAPKVGAPVAPAPAAPAPAAPAPAAPAPAAPAPAPAPALPTVVPGAFCPDSAVGQSGVGSNGHTYVCGGKGPDANGHYHWNS